nr:hypothetical protein [Candidatus Baldrarchaeota archaeon]
MLDQIIMMLLKSINNFRPILTISAPLLVLYVLYKFLTKKNWQRTRERQENNFTWFLYEGYRLNKEEKESFWYLILVPLFYFIIQNLNFQNLILELTLKLFLFSFIISLVIRIFAGEKYE